MAEDPTEQIQVSDASPDEAEGLRDEAGVTTEDAVDVAVDLATGDDPATEDDKDSPPQDASADADSPQVEADAAETTETESVPADGDDSQAEQPAVAGRVHTIR